MKTKEILLITTLALLLQGCGSNEDDTEISAALFYHDIKPEDRKEKTEEIQKHVGDYLFSDYKLNSETVGEGTLSRPAKNLVKKIWSQLESIGFSGFETYTLDSKSVKFTYVHISSSPIPGSGLIDPIYSDSFLNLSLHEKLMAVLMHKNRGIQFLINYQDPKEYWAFRPIFVGLTISDKKINVYDAPAEYRTWLEIVASELKADPFFKQFFEAPIAPTDSSGATSALSALKGKSGVDATQLMVNGISGSTVDLGLPIYVQLKGSVDQGKSTTGMTGLVAYKLGNSVLGVIQSYANSGTGFNTDSRQLESSIIAAHSFGLVFVEGQFGSVSASDVNFKDWSGLRSQVRFGVDTPFGAPFVQLTHRDFGSTSDTAGYVGFEIATTEFKADTYSFSTSLLTKVGHHSIHRTTGSIDWTAALNLNSGVAFNTNLTLGSALESKAAFNLSLDR